MPASASSTSARFNRRSFMGSKFMGSKTLGQARNFFDMLLVSLGVPSSTSQSRETYVGSGHEEGLGLPSAFEFVFLMKSKSVDLTNKCFVRAVFKKHCVV